MKLKNTDDWAKIMNPGPVFDAYNNSPHLATKIAPNRVNKDNEIQVLMNINKRAIKEHTLFQILVVMSEFQLSINNTKDIKIVSVWKAQSRR